MGVIKGILPGDHDIQTPGKPNRHLLLLSSKVNYAIRNILHWAADHWKSNKSQPSQACLRKPHFLDARRSNKLAQYTKSSRLHFRSISGYARTDREL